MRLDAEIAKWSAVLEGLERLAGPGAGVVDLEALLGPAVQAVVAAELQTVADMLAYAARRLATLAATVEAAGL